MSGAQKAESKPGEDSKAPKEQTGFECAEQVTALLNCVADRSYNEMKCLPLLRKLRTCIEKKGVVDFTIKPDEEGQQQH